MHCIALEASFPMLTPASMGTQAGSDASGGAVKGGNAAACSASEPGLNSAVCDRLGSFGLMSATYTTTAPINKFKIHCKIQHTCM